jgi:hypothetical protein
MRDATRPQSGRLQGSTRELDPRERMLFPRKKH